jgi:hypothetical protein
MDISDKVTGASSFIYGQGSEHDISLPASPREYNAVMIRSRSV